jgi:hypothetical protein
VPQPQHFDVDLLRLFIPPLVKNIDSNIDNMFMLEFAGIDNMDVDFGEPRCELVA